MSVLEEIYIENDDTLIFLWSWKLRETMQFLNVEKIIVRGPIRSEFRMLTILLYVDVSYIYNQTTGSIFTEGISFFVLLVQGDQCNHRKYATRTKTD